MDKENIKIPENILKIIDDGVVYTGLEKIADTYGLNLDQLGQLNVDTEGVIIGKIPSSDFVKIIAKNIEIPTDVAENIAKDINEKILLQIRQKLQEPPKPQTPPQPITQPKPDLKYVTIPSYSKPPTQKPITQTDHLISPIIHLNDVEPQNIVKEEIKIEPVTPPVYKEEVIDRNALLKGIEDSGDISVIDHMLSTPVTNKVEETRSVPIPKPEVPQPKIPRPVVDSKPYSADPYREQL